jgi:2-keto-4-pentenoate hydratase/2-oxohepta-3-ene-1,7-dioic acid hydratase in catechol pathway
MRIASIKPNGIGVVKDDSYVEVGEALSRDGSLPAGASVVDLIARYESLKDAISNAAARGSASKIDPKRLNAPVARPSKIWAAASNYRRGGTGIENAAGRGTTTTAGKAELLEMAFLKPSSAVTGPEQDVIIPPGADTIFPELELCVVIGKESRNLSEAEAMDAVFGYTVILDVTARSEGSIARGLIGSRCVRKGYDTFAPIGPWITTRDEIANPQKLNMRLWVNGNLKQSASTEGMINGVVELVSYLSHVSTLYPGDLIATGNPDAPDFQEKLVPGDVLKAEIEGIGSMNLYVQGPR